MTDKIYLLCSFIILTSFSSYGQSIISGQVTSEDHSILPFISVYVTDIDSNVIDHTYTNEKGKFSIVSDTSEYPLLLNISALGHESTIIRLDSTQSEDFLIKLTSSAVFEEVVINAHRKPIEEEGDTLRYNLENFIDSTEVFAEDILKKLPGIYVSPSGKIKFRGTEISTILIEDTDMFNSNYNLASKNIRIENLSSIEVISEYNSNPALKKINDNEEVVLNFKFKKSKLNILGGNIYNSVGSSIKPKLKTDNNANIFYISSVFKSLFLSDVGNTNNSNRSFLNILNTHPRSINDELLSPTTLEGKTENFQISYPVSPLYADNSWNDNITLRLFKNIKTWQIKISGTLSNYKDFQNRNEILNFENYDNLFDYNTQKKIRKYENELSTSYYSSNETFYFKSYTKLEFEDKSGISYINHLENDENKKGKSFFSGFEMTKRINNNSAINVVVKVQKQTYNERFTFLGGEHYEIFTIEKSDLLQKINTNSTMTNARLDYLRSKGHFSYRLFCNYNKEKVNIDLNQKYYTDSDDITYSFDNDFNKTELKQGFRLEYKKKLNQVHLQGYHKKLNALNYDFSHSNFFNARLSFINESKTGLKLKNTFQYYFPSIPSDDLIDLHYFTSPNNFLMEGYNEAFLKGFQYNFVIDYRDIGNNNYYFFEITQNWLKNIDDFEINSYKSILIATETTLKNSYRSSYNLRMSKSLSSWGLFGDVGVLYSYKNQSQKLNDNLNLFHDHNVRSNIKLSARANKYYSFNSEFKFNYSWNTYQNSTLQNAIYLIDLQNKLWLDNLEFSLNSNIMKTSQLEDIFLGLDFSAKLKNIPNTLLNSIEFSAHNLLNQQRINYSSSFDFYSFQSSTEIEPIFFLVKLDWNIN